MMRANERLARTIVSAAAVLALAGCQAAAGLQPSAPSDKRVSSITVTSKSLPPDLQVPVDFTCDGKDVPPQLTWSAPPEGTKALVVLVDDPDASSGSFTHYLAFNLPPETTSLAEGADATTIGAKIGLNDFKSVRYNGPCPPHGALHRYRFWVYAADYVLPLAEGASRADVDAALNGHLLGAGALKANFSR